MMDEKNDSIMIFYNARPVRYGSMDYWKKLCKITKFIRYSLHIATK